MHSFNTKLDCDDCVCLLPNGILVMHLTPRTYERIPVQHKKQSSKHFGLLKYGNLFYSLKPNSIFLNVTYLEVQIDLTNEKAKINELKEIFKNYKYSFYVYWEPNDDLKRKNLNVMETLGNYFTSDNLTACKSRFEKSCYALNTENLIDTLFNKSYLEEAENWKSLFNFYGCLINDVKV